MRSKVRAGTKPRYACHVRSTVPPLPLPGCGLAAIDDLSPAQLVRRDYFSVAPIQRVDLQVRGRATAGSCSTASAPRALAWMGLRTTATGPRPLARQPLAGMLSRLHLFTSSIAGRSGAPWISPARPSPTAPHRPQAASSSRRRRRRCCRARCPCLPALAPNGLPEGCCGACWARIVISFLRGGERAGAGPWGYCTFLSGVCHMIHHIFHSPSPRSLCPLPPWCSVISRPVVDGSLAHPASLLPIPPLIRLVLAMRQRYPRADCGTTSGIPFPATHGLGRACWMECLQLVETCLCPKLRPPPRAKPASQPASQPASSQPAQFTPPSALMCQVSVSVCVGETRIGARSPGPSAPTQTGFVSARPDSRSTEREICSDGVAGPVTFLDVARSPAHMPRGGRIGGWRRMGGGPGER
jgi:hypothetical protein